MLTKLTMHGNFFFFCSLFFSVKCKLCSGLEKAAVIQRARGTGHFELLEAEVPQQLSTKKIGEKVPGFKTRTPLKF